VKKLIISSALLFLLTGCPNEKEVKEMIDDISVKRNQTITVISSQDFSLDGLLKAQDYFFDFTEKVHLMNEDSKSLNSIKSLINNYGMKNFCEKFVVSVQLWTNLENYCKSTSPYRCSPDIHTYNETQNKFLGLIGNDLKSKFKREPACN